MTSKRFALFSVGALLSLSAVALTSAFASDRGVTYKCPGNHYSNTMSAKEAKDKGCKLLDAPPISVIQSVKPRAAASAGPAASGSSTRIDPAEQRARDSDARRILEGELKREDERLAAMKAEFKGGVPDHQGDEAKNHQKYLDRVNDMRSAINRKESDIAALKRELAKLPQ